eukprot:COSAG06_NODE_12844_length_1321_cov_2.236498_2_plen_71_part_00
MPRVDWILYKGEGLTFVNGSSAVDMAPLDGGSATEAEWEAALAMDPGAADSLTYCSDHSALLAKFRVAQR